ncbi:MAG: hypothetical protein IKP41_03775 [Bacteroidaceae bacterium]|nr:hypothetical protein [Bacteroidaceae bacterium]
MKKTIVALLAASLTMGATAQTENPRGIYKLMKVTGKMGEVKAPFDQYKVCTDSITLMVSVQREEEAVFTIGDNDHKVFDYTGEEPKSADDKSTLIFDSNAEHFSMKWWSQYADHELFPNNDWCTEKYESGRYSLVGRLAFDALTGKAVVDPHNPLTGTWRIITDQAKSLDNIKKELPAFREQSQKPTSAFFNSFIVMSPEHTVWIIAGILGNVERVEYGSKEAFKTFRIDSENDYQVKWLSKDRIAVRRSTSSKNWMIMERMTDGQTPLSSIASQFFRQNR